MEYRCSRCQTVKPELDFHPSQREDGKWCKACYREWHRSRYTPSTGADDSVRACIHCGVEYQPAQRRPSIYCSRTCKELAYKAQWVADLHASKPDRSCVWCQAPLPRSMRIDAKFCSQACNAASHRQTVKIRRRTGQRSTAVSLPMIAERDGFRCGICGGKVDMTLKHPDPMFGSLDHILPLAAGGKHEASNLQLAHLRCNLSKRDRAKNDQLRLI